MIYKNILIITKWFFSTKYYINFHSHPFFFNLIFFIFHQSYSISDLYTIFSGWCYLKNKSDFVTPPLTTFLVSGIFKDVVSKFPPISSPLFSLTVVVLGLYPLQFLGLDYFSSHFSTKNYMVCYFIYFLKSAIKILAW